MWLFRLAGVLMLACSGLAVSQTLNRRATAALCQTEGFMALIRAVRGQIECFARPIGQILFSCERETLDACGYAGEMPPSDLAVLVKQVRVYDAPTVAAVARFSEEFGRGYRADEVRACDYTLSLLEDRRTRLAGELPQKKKRNVVLCVCASLALALLLL